jgi:hypothetical protein
MLQKKTTKTQEARAFAQFLKRREEKCTPATRKRESNKLFAVCNLQNALTQIDSSKLLCLTATALHFAKIEVDS